MPRETRQAARNAVDGVSFQVRAGEILGIAGVQGNGQTELCEALMGLRPGGRGRPAGRPGHHPGHSPGPAAGGHRLHPRGPAGRRDRHGFLGGGQPRAGHLRPPAVHAKGIAMNLGAIREDATRLASEFDIRTSSIDTLVGTLSGGNQQKVILAREVGRRVRLLLASQPTRGLDVGSIEFVHRRIVEERDQGVAVHHRLVRARRDLRAGRPDSGHVRGQDHRVPAADRARGRTGPADGGRRDAAGRRGPTGRPWTQPRSPRPATRRWG